MTGARTVRVTLETLCCPEQDFTWYRRSIGVPAPLCPNHGLRLVGVGTTAEVDVNVEGAMRALGLLPLNEPVFHIVSTFLDQLKRRGFQVTPIKPMKKASPTPKRERNGKKKRRTVR